MVTTPQEPVNDSDIETAGAPPAAGKMGLGDADGTDGTDGGDADGTDGTSGNDTDSTDASDADGTDGSDADGTDA